LAIDFDTPRGKENRSQSDKAKRFAPKAAAWILLLYHSFRFELASRPQLTSTSTRMRVNDVHGR
jgi:hypothetical protein